MILSWLKEDDPEGRSPSGYYVGLFFSSLDLGAQFFHPGPNPVYTALLKSLDLFPPDIAAPPPSQAFPASITIGKPAKRRTR